MDGSLGLHEILLYPIMYNVQEFEIGTLSKAVNFQKLKDLYILTKTSRDNILNPVLHASVC